MTEVDIYDIESEYWFRQKTFDSGNGIPSGRGAMCLELIPAADGSSWNIIMVAGILTFDSKGSTSRQEMQVKTFSLLSFAKSEKSADTYLKLGFEFTNLPMGETVW